MLRESTQSYASGLCFLAACALLSGAIAWFVVTPTEAARTIVAVSPNA